MVKRKGKSLEEIVDEIYGKNSVIKYFGFMNDSNDEFFLTDLVHDYYHNTGKLIPPGEKVETLPSGRPRCGHKYLKKQINKALRYRTRFDEVEKNYFAKVVSKKIHSLRGDPEFDRKMIEKGIRQLMSALSNEELIDMGYNLMINAHRELNPNNILTEEQIRNFYEPLFREYLRQIENQV